jgi:hypothetical protein
VGGDVWRLTDWKVIRGKVQHWTGFAVKKDEIRSGLVGRADKEDGSHWSPLTAAGRIGIRTAVHWNQAGLSILNFGRITF